MKQYYRILKEYVMKKDNMGLLAAVFVLLSVSSATAFVMPYLTKCVIDILTEAQPVDNLHLICTIATLTILGTCFIGFCQNLVTNRITQNISIYMKKGMYQTILKKEWNFYHKFNSGELLYRLHNDAVIIADNAAFLLIDVLISVLVIIIVNIVLVSIAWNIALLLDIILLSSSLLTTFLKKKVRGILRKCRVRVKLCILLPKNSLAGQN